VYVGDWDTERIRKIDASGNVTTLAGSGGFGFADGQGTSAIFARPNGVAVDGSGNVYVADHNNHRIRQIDVQGNVTTLAGSGDWAFADGQGTSASFGGPIGVAVDGSGNVYVGDYYNNRIRKIETLSSPTPSDSDGDGVNDYREEKDGTNPNNSSFFNPLSKGLVAYYPFNGNANDESGNGKAATLSANSTFQSGFSSRQALKIVGNGSFFRENTAEFPSLDKSNAGQFVEIPEPNLINPHIFSSSIWVNEEGMTNSDGESFITAGYGPKSMPLIANYYLINENSSLSSQTKLTDSNPGPDLQTSVKLDTIQNVWTNYMVVCNGIDLTVYKNGIKIHSGNVFGKPQGNWSIGRHWWDNGDTFSTRFIGLVADCRIYNRALTAAEVLQLYSEESGEPNMVTVQGGTLPTGSALAGQVVGHFQIGKYEVTWGEWKAVRDWAVANGYTDLANIGEGSGDDHPVRNVNWFDVVKWCNAKSEKEGLNPVYFSSNSIFRTGKFWNFESGVISMRFNANGYRLPLEKEWEWAARGAILSQGYTYSGGNNLEAVGWYSGNSKNAEVGLHQVSGSIIRFSTILGEFDVELFNESTPNTVENFLGYLRRGDYNNSIIHRSVPGFVIQGGGFRLEENSILPIPTVPPVLDEPIHPNFRGTIAMAKIGGTLNSATNQWFINLSNNSPNLDYQSGGFTVFGEVVGTGMTVVDNISGLEVINASTQLGSAFGSLPLLQQELLASNLVLINKVEEISLPIFAGTWPVGKKLPNELGIHDMSGNLWEWCWEAIDWNELGYARRIRGGSWSGSAEGCQNSFRITGGPHSTNDRYTTNGFRLARNASGSIQPATPVITTLPVASGINFGQSLSNSTLTGGVASVNGTTVAGSFAFASPSTVPPVGNSTHSVVFTPNDSVNYTTATANVTVSVSKAGAVISTLPSASSITFGQALSSSVLTGGAANVAGSFAFASPSTKPGAGNSTQGVVFTPTDSGNYTTATANVTVRVLQAVPEVSVWPTASPLKFGQALSASVLSGGSAGVAGAFGFVNPSTIPPLGLTTQAVRFTPADSGNYTTLSSNVTVTVDKAGPVISSLPTASAITEGQSLAASVLTGGSANVAGSFAFAVPGTVPAVGNSTHGVVFSPVDAGNYTVAAGNVTVRVNALPSFSLNTTSTPGGNVTASAAGPHKQGSTVTLTAVPDSGFVFVRWAGNATGTVNPLSLTVGGNLSVVAIFSQAEPADTNVQEFTGGSLLGVGPSGSVAGGANGVAATPDGGMVSVGDFTGTFQALGQNHTAGVNNRSFAIKHSANGTIQWAVSTGASGALVKNERVAVDAAGNIFVAGIFTGTVNFGPATLTAKGNTNADIFVAKLHSSNGTVQWVASGGGTNSETLNGLLAGADGEAYVTGGYFGANATFGSLALAAQTGGNSNRDAYLGRISSNGTWQWVVAAGGSSTDQGRAVAVRDAGSLWWGGNFQGSAAVGPQQLTSQGATDIFVAAVDAASGNTTSPIRFGGTGEDALTALVSDRGEGFYASGSFASDMALGSVSLANSGVGDGFVARWQKNAGWTWGVALQGGDDDLATSLAMDAEGRLYAGGYFASESLTAASSTLNNTELFSYDGFVARFTSVGGVKWLRGLRGDYNDYVRGVACVSAGASTGALHLVGYTESALSGDAVSLQAPKGSGDAFFVRMNPASAAPSRTVTVNPSVGGMVTLSPAGPSYPLGTQVTLTPLPAAGFGFVRWGGSASGNATPLTITVNQSVSIDAEFADIGAPLVTVNSPAEGMQLPSAKVDFTGVVTDNVGVVSAAWGLNGVEKGNLTLTQNGSFSVPAVPLVPGDNLFTVVAVDAAGNEAVEEVLLVWSPSRVFSLPATVSVNEGRTLKIPVRLTSEGGVGGFRLQVNFDPAVFSSANFSFTGQAALGESLWTAPSPGRVVLLTSLGGGSISSGIQQIGELTLRVRSVPLGGLANAIGVEVLDVSNNLGNPLLDGTGSSGCTVNVRSRSLPADINGNGFVDSGDGALLKTLIAEQDPERPWDVALNDLNATGSLDTGDLTKLLRIVVGFDPKPSPLVQPKAIRTTSMRTMSFAAMSLAPSIPAFFQNNGTRTPVEVRVSGNLDGQTLLAEVVLPPMGSALNSLEFELQYPANLLQIAEAQAGEAAPLNAQVNPAFGNSTIRFAAFNNSPWAATGGTVLRVTFTRNSGAPAGSARHLITLENLLAFTGGGSDSLEVFQRPAALGRQMQNWLGEVVSNAPADADSDGDGMTNRQEFLAGTDPNDRGSLLQLDGFLHDPAKGEQTLTWRAKRGVRYRVQSSENLSLWTTDNSTELLGNDGDVSLSIKPVGSKTKLFYRLQVVE
jgi:cyclophilin family peptidyl-prolyl cis-trans isomerase/formylglycine-generating enzyme required for sulfatase activity